MAPWEQGGLQALLSSDAGTWGLSVISVLLGRVCPGFLRGMSVDCVPGVDGGNRPAPCRVLGITALVSAGRVRGCLIDYLETWA